MRIYYPSEHLPPYHAPLLDMCIKYPLVLFLPGEAPPGIPQADYYQKWERFGSVLARSGYIVAVPQDSGELPDTDYDPAVKAAQADIAYLQNSWSGSKSVMTNASSTTVGGVSNGALLAARIAAANPNLGAYFSLGGQFHALPDPEQAASVGGMPSFFMWAKNESRGSSLEDLHVDKIWDNLQQNRYAVRYEGEHYDYVPPGQTGTWPVGTCQNSVGGFAADLLALFVASFIHSYTTIDEALIIPSSYLDLTDMQKSWWDDQGHLTGEFVYTLSCKAGLEWWIFDHYGRR